MTAFTELLSITHPIVQAPMAGGTTTPELVAAVSEAGGLGSVGAAYMRGDEIVAIGEAVRTMSSRPFSINLFAPTPPPTNRPLAPAVARIAARHAELGIEPPRLEVDDPPVLDDQVEAVMTVGPAMLSFTFGVLERTTVEAVRGRGIIVAGTATNVAEAQALEALGVDAVVAQGSEAGGHRGTFIGSFEAAMVGTMALVPQIVDAVAVPVIASGGIMDGRGIVAALALGAGAVQMGTAFLLADEAGAAEAHKATLAVRTEVPTRVTTAFSGRPARGVPNDFMDEVDRSGDVVDFPVQNRLTRAMRRAASARGRTDLMSLWSGQAAGLGRRLPARELVEALSAETRAVLANLPDMMAGSSRNEP